MDILIFKLYHFREMISKLTSFLTRKKGGCLSFATGYDNNEKKRNRTFYDSKLITYYKLEYKHYTLYRLNINITYKK